MTTEKIIARVLWILVNAVAFVIAFIPGGAVMYAACIIISKFVDMYTFFSIMLIVGFLDTALMVGIHYVIMRKFCKLINSH